MQFASLEIRKDSKSCKLHFSCRNSKPEPRFGRAVMDGDRLQRADDTWL